MEFEKLQTASLKELFISSVEDKILSGEPGRQVRYFSVHYAL